MSRTLLHNAGVLTMDADGRLFENGAILIDGRTIAQVGRTADLLPLAGPDVETIDLSGRWILPGLINTHVHTSQQLGRGLGDDVDLLTWLHERIWPYESVLTEEDSFVSSLLTGIELIRGGVTTFCEAGGQHVNGMGRAVSQLGLRALLCRSTMDMGEGLPVPWQIDTDESLRRNVEDFDNWHGQAEGRIRACFGLRTIFNDSDDLILRTSQLARERGTLVNMHVAEIPYENEFARQRRGLNTVSHLAELGVLGPEFLAVHCVWLTDEEIGLFARHQVKVSHNPAAAMRVLGMPKIVEMQAAGVCVSLGTDGAPSSNRMTLIDEMWLTSLLHKLRTGSPQAMPAERVLAMVTREAARSLQWESEIGSLEPGKRADLAVINPATATMLPMHDPVANFVSSMREHNVESVMVDGRWLMRDRNLLTVNEAEIIAAAIEAAASIRSRAGIKLPPRFPTVA
jgi:5-methylthioadenosine/S-adenosylhomocysteine deaminase